ncbi:MAG: Cytochrome c1 heme lyase [Stictis urceolatum]|nr:Cytochrome c1 heme lyase [Stictis urceolata]
MASDVEPPVVCPVDHSARNVWAQKAQREDKVSQSSLSSDVSSSGETSGKNTKTRPLSLDREVSSIPRADTSISTSTPDPASRPANSESETGRDNRSGKWIYPSEKMFFEAMKRKNHSPAATDMAAVVPIHNAVNERAWKEIKEWEQRFAWSRSANQNCGGPRLYSFSGDSKKLSPRARWNSLLGYQEPFDRHDWIVERCAGQPNVEYVIDFYSGKSDGIGGKLNFYLDVRPKLNSWEGWKMRVAGMLGL